VRERPLVQPYSPTQLPRERCVTMFWFEQRVAPCPLGRSGSSTDSSGTLPQQTTAIKSSLQVAFVSLDNVDVVYVERSSGGCPGLALMSVNSTQ
jgi:hypothetical protein